MLRERPGSDALSSAPQVLRLISSKIYFSACPSLYMTTRPCGELKCKDSVASVCGVYGYAGPARAPGDRRPHRLARQHSYSTVYLTCI